jgi:hypothetical protein
VGPCRRHANLRDSTNRKITSPKPFRLFSTEPARFGFAWKSASLFKHLKIWPTEPSAAGSLGYQDELEPEVDVAERSNAWRMRGNIPRAAGRAHPSARLRGALRYTRDDRIENAQCVDRAVRLALLKVLFRLRHCVCNVGKTEKFSVAEPSECIENGGFHLDSEYAP